MKAPPTPYERLDRLPQRVRAILMCVAEETGVPALEIIGDSRTKATVRARWTTFYRLRTMTYGRSYPSLPRIGIWFAKDHTTVLNALRMMNMPLPPSRPERLVNRGIAA